LFFGASRERSNEVFFVDAYEWRIPNFEDAGMVVFGDDRMVSTGYLFLEGAWRQVVSRPQLERVDS
jgi:hypothetical protein